MKITTVLFDLDGTLLPMDQDIFAGAYVKGLAMTAAAAGYDPKAFAKAVLAGTYAMIRNDGSAANEEVFWQTLAEAFGSKVRSDMHIFDEFYRTDFQKIADLCGCEPKVAQLVGEIRNRGYRIALATNPLFPKIATESRIRWAGLAPDDFEIFTTYETSHYCKPNIEYYKELLNTLQVNAEECLMIGNDATEDMVAEKLGMKVFLLTDCLINKADADISVYPHGGFDELAAFVDELCGTEK